MIRLIKLTITEVKWGLKTKTKCKFEEKPSSCWDEWIYEKTHVQKYKILSEISRLHISEYRDLEAKSRRLRLICAGLLVQTQS